MTAAEATVANLEASMQVKSTWVGKSRSVAIGGGKQASFKGTPSFRSNFINANYTSVDMSDLEFPGELLGEGMFGQVHKHRESKTGLWRVVKTVSKRDGWDDDKMKKEAEVLREFDHPHILRLFTWYEEDSIIYMVMEYCAGGEFLASVKEAKCKGLLLPESWASVALRQVFYAILYMHNKGVVHKDLKSGNLLLLRAPPPGISLFKTVPHVVVGDLGLAEVCAASWYRFERRGNQIAGTPGTMAPEVWSGNCGPKSDVWSAGCIMFELLTGKLPFRPPPKLDKELWLEIHRQGPNWGTMNSSREAKALNQSLLVVKENKRPTAKEVVRHAFFESTQAKSITNFDAQGLCQAILSWRHRSPMQRAICLLLATDCTCIDKFSGVFSLFDSDNSGSLSKQELIAALRRLSVDDKTARSTSAALDINGDGNCEYLEFTAACLSSLGEYFNDMLWQEFLYLDIHNRGELTMDEMNPLLDKLRPLAAQRGIELRDIDIDGNGTISYKEFASFFGVEDADRRGAKAQGDASASPPRRSLSKQGSKESVGRQARTYSQDRAVSKAAKLSPEPDRTEVDIKVTQSDQNVATAPAVAAPAARLVAEAPVEAVPRSRSKEMTSPQGKVAEPMEQENLPETKSHQKAREENSMKVGASIETSRSSREKSPRFQDQELAAYWRPPTEGPQEVDRSNSVSSTRVEAAGIHSMDLGTPDRSQERSQERSGPKDLSIDQSRESNDSAASGAMQAMLLLQALQSEEDTMANRDLNMIPTHTVERRCIARAFASPPPPPPPPPAASAPSGTEGDTDLLEHRFDSVQSDFGGIDGLPVVVSL